VKRCGSIHQISDSGSHATRRKVGFKFVNYLRLLVLTKDMCSQNRRIHRTFMIHGETASLVTLRIDWNNTACTVYHPTDHKDAERKSGGECVSLHAHVSD
jgi:hypothetical protein